MKPKQSHLPLLISLAATLFAGLATSLPALAEEKQSWYSVEVIAFLHLDSRHRDAETWLDERHNIDLSEIEPLFDPAPYPSLPFQQRVPEQFSLAAAAAKLSRSAEFEAIIHTAWIQPSYPRERPRIVGFDQRFTEPGKSEDHRSRITGTLSFSEGRYLHLANTFVYSQWLSEETPNSLFSVDENDQFAIPSAESFTANPVPQLKLGSNPWNKDETRPDQYADVPVDLDEEPAPEAHYQDYQLTEERRIRLNEVHYFDHPAFGILVQVQRYEAEQFRPDLDFDSAAE
ncbi:MAG: hypothetical protein ACI9HX_000367 [Pseudoalteromonas tetraodonis]|jgi:hypothetical protein